MLVPLLAAAVLLIVLAAILVLFVERRVGVFRFFLTLRQLTAVRDSSFVGILAAALIGEASFLLTYLSLALFLFLVRLSFGHGLTPSRRLRIERAFALV